MNSAPASYGDFIGGMRKLLEAFPLCGFLFGLGFLVVFLSE